jgi:hypothetical protein
VAIFIHLYEMFMGVHPSVRLIRCFFVMKTAPHRWLLLPAPDQGPL